MRALSTIGEKPVATALFVGALALFLGSCAIQLAPAYDASIVSGLNGANTQAQTMFATVSTGVTKDTYASVREAQYNALIGQFAALDSQVAARPMPQPPSFITSLVGDKSLPSTNTSQIPKLDTAPSKAALDHIVKALTAMRDEDAKNGLAASNGCPSNAPPVATCLFENDYAGALDSALTYEMALQR